MHYKYYAGIDDSDSDKLMHLHSGTHKYIDKYKSKSGKWVYVYADKATHAKIKNLQKESEKYKDMGMESYYRTVKNKKQLDYLRDHAKKLANGLHMGYSLYQDEKGNLEYLDRSAVDSYNDMADAVQNIGKRNAAKTMAQISMSISMRDAAEDIINKYAMSGLNAFKSAYSPGDNFKSRKKNVTGLGKSVKRR